MRGVDEEHGRQRASRALAQVCTGAGSRAGASVHKALATTEYYTACRINCCNQQGHPRLGDVYADE